MVACVCFEYGCQTVPLMTHFPSGEKSKATVSEIDYYHFGEIQLDPLEPGQNGYTSLKVPLPHTRYLRQ